MTYAKLIYDENYTNVFHSPGIEPWITGFLKGKKFRVVLDVGCGLGFMGLLLKLYLNSTERLVGLDISSNKLIKVKKLNLFDHLVVADARRLPFRDSVFDLIISTEVLHGLPAETLEFLEKVKKVNGSIVLALPSLPANISVKYLICKAYRVYRYLLRGFVLIDLESYSVFTIGKSRFFKILKLFLIILKPFLRVTGLLDKGYLLAFK